MIKVFCLAAVGLTIAATGCESSNHGLPIGQMDRPSPSTGALAANLAVPEGHIPVRRARARGVIIYTWSRTKHDPARFEWKVASEEGQLFNLHGDPVGQLSRGPAWTIHDGSCVEGQFQCGAPATDANAIDCALYKTVNSRDRGVLQGVTYVQRLNTRGGAPPADVADAPHEGRSVRVPFTANYLFFRPAQ